MSSPTPEESVVPRPLADAWRTAKPSAVELQRGYSRYLSNRKPRRRALGFARWMLGGLVLGAGLAQAASAVPWHDWTGKNQVVSRAPRAPKAASERSAAAAPPVPAVSPQDVAVGNDLPRAVPAMQPTAAARPVPTVTPVPSAAAFEVREQWRLAAEGLRTGNFASAHQALLELERTTRGGERDAARLARAQLLSSHGRNAEALALGSELEQHAGSALVRSKASALRERLTKRSESDRSPAAAVGINQP